MKQDYLTSTLPHYSYVKIVFLFLFLFSLQITATEDDTTVACTGTVVVAYPYTESFESGLGDWTQSVLDGGNWTQRTGTTPSGQTGPLQASDGSQYFYTEASVGQNPGNNSNAILVSPCLDLTGESEAWFSFDYHMYGVDMGNLQVDVSSDAGLTWTNEVTITGGVQSSSGRPWRKIRINLASYVGNTINIRINGNTGINYRSDIAIDNVVVTNEPQYCGSMAIYNPSTIRRVAFNTIDNSSPIENIGYTDYTNIETTVERGDVHDLTVQINTNGNFAFDIRAFIDWNRDFDFDDAGEVYNLGTQQNVTNGATSNSPLSITIPTGATLGKTRMRVTSRFAGVPGSCDEDNNFFGEVEDYTLEVITSTPQPEMSITGNSIVIDDNDVTPSAGDFTDFGSTTTGSTLSRVFTINNIGTAALNLTGGSPYIVISGPDAGLFTINTAPTSPIASNGSSSFSIDYNPIVGGTHNATISIANDDANENPYNFAISGSASGPQPEISMRGNGNVIMDNSTTAATANGTDYGVIINNTTLSRTFNIDNTGAIDLTLTDASPYVTISGSTDFTLTAIPSSPIAPGGGTTAFEITYSPTATGTDTATVSIANNDADENPFNFVITGQSTDSIEPEIQIDGNGNVIVDNDTTPSAVDNTDFGIEYIGSSQVRDFTITNTGTGDLTLTGAPLVELVGGDAGQFSVTSFPSATVAASGGTTQFEISYNPTTVAVHTTTVRVSNDDTDEADYTFTITGEGQMDVNPKYTIYYENFNETDGNWTMTNSGSGSTWTYGANATEAPTDGNYWYTDSYNNFTSGSDTYAVSPIIDLTGFEDLRLQLDVRYNLDNDLEDGMNIEYSADGGSTWQVLGTTAEPAYNRWYNDTSINGLGTIGWSGINEDISTSVGIKSQFTTSMIDLPASLINNSQARFRVRFADNGNGTRDDGANFDNVFIFGNSITPFSPPTEGPANVTSNLKLWLRSSEGITATSGTPPTLWEDFARDNDATTDNSNAPIYYDSSAENINHNPVLAFSEADNTRLRGKGGFFSQDYWLVFRQNGTISGAQDASFESIAAGRASRRQFSEDATGFWTGNISIRFQGESNMISHMVGSTPASADASTRDSYGRAYESSSDTYTDEVIIFNVKRNSAGTASEIYKNGIRIDNLDAYANDTGVLTDILPYDDFLNSEYIIGTSRAELNRNDLSTGFNGKFTEFISFSNPNTSLGRRKIQSYLAIKNGVTLHSENSTTVTRQGDTDYIDSAGNVIWSNSLNSGYTFDIAGIGRDDDATLYQKQSTSSNNGAVLTMGLTDIYATNNQNLSTNPDDISDKDFLIWGNNNASFSASAPIVVDMSAEIGGLTSEVDFISVQRSWKVVETGNIGNVKISIPEIALSATITPPGDFLMFISDTPSFSPTSEYRVMTVNGPNLETTYDFVGTKYITFGYAPEYYYERSVSFDGVQDYMDADDVADLTGPFTISAWVKRGSGVTNAEIVSKRNLSPFTSGYSLRLNNAGRPRMLWKDAGGTTRSFNSSVVLPENEWHHVAVIYDGTEATMIIDGVEDTTLTAPPPVDTDEHLMIAAGNYLNPSRFFEGTIDEVRIWNEALSLDQLHFIMNQEIEKFTDGSVLGKIVPQTISKNEVASLPWTDLEIYLPMNRYTFTNVKDESDNGHVAAIKNLETVDFQTAPLPYISAADGAWTNTATWINGTTQELPGAASLVDGSQTIDWNIVQTSHDITTNANNTVLSLEVAPSEISIENDSKIEVTHYLKLDGVMDLVGESQLIQTENSDLDIASIGRLERDQQGTSDTYSYNLWSSPVGQINTSAINQAMTVASVMNDGTNANAPASMNFSGSYNGAPTSPITISAFWLYAFRNHTIDDYSAWEYIGPFGSLEVGDGYTMKGAGTGGITDPQNYVFIGKPNNSTSSQPIDKPIDAGSESLIGNPFPSAMDADIFINDNPHLTGTLYFWEHWGGGNHILADYQAGYALYNLSGGTPAVSHPAVDQTGSGTKTPTQFIAVGQGFFVRASSTGTTSFDNRQRTFAKQATSSTFFFNPEDDTTEDVSNIEDDVVLREDTREKFRIGFDSPSQFHRQLLMTIDENTTFGYDRAYDGLVTDHPQEDMTWMLEDSKAIILGVPAIENEREFPVRVTLPMDGEISIGVDALENVDTDVTRVFVLDALYGTYTDVTEVEKYTLNLTAGTYEDRFYIVFRRKTENQDQQQDTTDETDTTEDQDTVDTDETQDQEVENEEVEVIEVENDFEESIESDSIDVFFDGQSGNIVINKRADYYVESIQLYTILGQVIKEWKPNSETTQLSLPVQEISTGPYILSIQKMQTTHTEKLIIH